MVQLQREPAFILSDFVTRMPNIVCHFRGKFAGASQL